MGKAAKKTYTCQSCGTLSTKWSGKCEDCGEWNSFVENADSTSGIGAHPGRPSIKGRKLELVSLDGENTTPDRLKSGLGEFDRVTGGGLVPGSTLLVGGDPGIGKSTLLLQLLGLLAQNGKKTVYVSGEEAITQIRLRAARLGFEKAPVSLAAETNLADIRTTLEAGEPPDCIVIDSVQTMWSPSIDASPGTVTQVRTVTQELIRFAKMHNTTVIIVGHVTKDGQIAGPRVMEHMVDTVLYFEGERGHQFRILRSVKNRFGATDEIGVFEMTDRGLCEITNPSELFLNGRNAQTPGSAVFADLEGTRPVLVEVQALVTPSGLGTPRRTVVGWDNNRLATILAVLEAHCGITLSSHDVYLNIAGGLRIKEPAADMAVASALVSSLCNTPLPVDAVYFGEVSLSGALRPVSHIEARLKEAAKLGFETAFLPKSVVKNTKKMSLPDTITLKSCDNLIDLSSLIAATQKMKEPKIA